MHGLWGGSRRFRAAASLITLALLGGAATACASAATPARTASRVSTSAYVSAAEQRAVLAFSGTYKLRPAVAGRGAVTVQADTWQAVPQCDSQGCAVTVTTSAGGQAFFTYRDGEYVGITTGTLACYGADIGMGGASIPMVWDYRLKPAAGTGPVPSMSATIQLASHGLCFMGPYRFTLVRTGS